MKRCTSSGKNREFGVTVSLGIGRVFLKMLSNSRVMSDNLRSAVCFSDTGKIRAVLKRMIIPDRPGNALLNAFMQSLECTSDVPTVAVVRGRR